MLLGKMAVTTEYSAHRLAWTTCSLWMDWRTPSRPSEPRACQQSWPVSHQRLKGAAQQLCARHFIHFVPPNFSLLIAPLMSTLTVAYRVPHAIMSGYNCTAGHDESTAKHVSPVASLCSVMHYLLLLPSNPACKLHHPGTAGTTSDKVNKCSNCSSSLDGSEAPFQHPWEF